MDWRRLAQSVKRAGFDGVDLTVRKGGHVAPERAAEEPAEGRGLDPGRRARSGDDHHGLLAARSPPRSDPFDRRRLGIPLFKRGITSTTSSTCAASWKRPAATSGARGVGEAALVAVGYHNHAGYLGAPVWDMARVIDTLDPKWVGYYFDVCHATTEGATPGGRSRPASRRPGSR